VGKANFKQSSIGWLGEIRGEIILAHAEDEVTDSYQ